jgi:hypothetical protein
MRREVQHVGIDVSPAGIRSAQQVERGDTIYVWLGGAGRPGTGLIARVRASTRADRALSAPWPDPGIYSYVIPFDEVEELAQAIQDRHPGNGKGVRFKIQNTDLQKSLRPLSDESQSLLAVCFERPESAAAD